MKKNILLFTIIAFLLNCSNDDTNISVNVGNLFIGDAILTTQGEINTFAAQEYSGIVGSLVIGNPDEASNITDISTLNTLDYVSLSIVIQNTNLVSLNGLENINREPDFEIRIENNLLLENVDALSNIPGEDISITISNNSSLISLLGLEGITGVSFRLRIINNPELLSLEGLNSIEFANGIEIIDNSSLVSLSGLDQLNSLRSASIRNNSSLESLNGLQNLISAPFSLNIINNDILNDLTALSNLSSEIDFLNISNNEALDNLNGLENVEFFNHSIFISENSSLSDFCAIQTPLSNRSPNNTNISNNTFNPTVQDIIDGNCSQ